MSRMRLEKVEITDFVLEGDLGSGASARVFEAKHRTSGLPVAIKRMADGRQPVELRERFAREARMLADIASPHVVRVLGYGFVDDQPFLVLERLVGETLDARLRRYGRVSIDVAGPWVEQIILGIRDCHDANVIHRDLKPSNIFLAKTNAEETVKLIDFGVARPRERSGDHDILTATGDVIGSLGYMAPEQFRDARRITTAVDVFAIGVITFKLLAGRLPFGPMTISKIDSLDQGAPAPDVAVVSGSEENRAADAFLKCALAFRPEGRFPSARVMLEAWWRVMASIDSRADAARSEHPADHEEPTLRQSSPSLSPSSGAFFLDDTPTLDDPGLRERVEAEREVQAKREKTGD